MIKIPNLKDKATTFAAGLSLFGTFLAGLNYLWIHLPSWVTAIGGTMVGLGVVINGIFGGKNPDGSTKTPSQVAQLNQQAADTRPPKDPVQPIVKQ
jgi:hypothetical protein